jgi:predicted dehydrogenase
MQATRIGVAGLSHGHVWGLIQAAKDLPGATLAAVADPTPLLDRARGDFGQAFSSWREMLDRVELDALIVTSDNVESSEIAVRALERGVPCLVEKAMAANAADADRMLEAQRQSGRALMINWPLAWNPWLYELKRSIDAGSIGHVFHFRFRIGHYGPREIGCDEWFVGWLYDEARNGGGAIADFGCYGAVLTRWLFGMPESVYCVRHNTTKDYPVSDDHAILVLRYPRRDVVLEGTWATRAWDDGPNPVAFGKDGTLAVYGNDLRLHDGREVRDLEVPDLPSRNPMGYFLECIREGREPEGILNPSVAADACRILDAALASAADGRAHEPV